MLSHDETVVIIFLIKPGLAQYCPASRLRVV